MAGTPVSNVTQPINKAAPASFHTSAAPINGGGSSRNAPAAPFRVGHVLDDLAHGAEKAVSNAATGAVKGVKMMGSMAGAFGKAVTGNDDFSQQVSRQAKAGRFNK